MGQNLCHAWRALVDSEIPCVLNIFELMALDVAHGIMASHADVSILIQRTWKRIITWKKLNSGCSLN